MNLPPFALSISDATRELLVHLHDRAAAHGLRAEFLTALRTIERRLQTAPSDFGEEVFDLPALELTIKVGVVLPLAVDFGIYLERRLVVIRTFRFVAPAR